jgi:hypothetical protein
VKTLQPQHLLHRGVVQADGFVFDTRFLTLTGARQRVLALWTPGASVHLLPYALLLCLPEPLLTNCDEAPGLPLVRDERLLTAMPLTADERRNLLAAPGSVVLAVGGDSVVYELAHATEEAPADWLDVSGWTGVRGVSLGTPPKPPRLVAEAEPFDARSKLPGVPPEAPERLFVLEALRKAAQGDRVEDATTAGVGGAANGIGDRVGGWLKRMLGKGGANQVRAVEPRSTTGEGVRWLAAKLLRASGLSSIIGRRQAEYIGRMLEMFERGDLSEALRHAIPMGEMEAGKPKPPALGVPTARPDLTIGLTRTEARSSFHVATDLHDHMMKLYRDAFRKLEAEGRIEEAAFVLAELLGVNEEAVAFLERHGRLKLAAEMAEARKLFPGLVVRLWFLAGDTQRAVLVARRTGAFADAVLRLDRQDGELRMKHPDAARRAWELRLLWAESLATAGDYAGAMQVIEPILTTLWPIEGMRQQIADWIDAGLALGGIVGARMLARKIDLFPENHGAAREQALALLDDQSVETAMTRAEFAAALVGGQSTPLTRTLARAAARAVLRDMGAEATTLEPLVWQGLVRFADDAVLRIDAPVLPNPVEIEQSWETPHTIRIEAEDSGILPIYDAALLPDGRCILALGESGLRLITRDGRTVMHADQPAHRLVVSDHGNQVIALAPRGDVWRMARMNLLTRKVEVWREAALRTFAPDHDGSLWFVAVDKDLLAIDVTAPGFDALWRLPNLEGTVLSIARSQSQCSLLLFAAGATDSWGRPTGLWTRREIWTHSLPDLLLRNRKEVASPPPNAEEGKDYAWALGPDGRGYSINVTETGPIDARWEIRLKIADAVAGDHLLGTATERPYLLPPVVGPTCVAVPTRRSDGIVCYVLHCQTLELLAEITLGGAQHVSLRQSGPHWAIADDRGRLLVIDPHHREPVRNLRLK